MAAESTGYLDFSFGTETFQTWYKIVGDLGAGARPIIVLHGGPGMSHDYLFPLTDLYTTKNIPVVFYDQIGTSRSTHLPDKPTNFWTVEFFMDELQNLLNRLGISNNFDLLGHSWGGMLAISFAIERKPAGLKRLVISNSPASMELHEQGLKTLLEGLPAQLRHLLMKHEAEGTTDDEEYQKGMVTVYKKHVCMVDPWPQEVLDSVASIDKEPVVYHTMCGPSEFCISGTLRSWTVVDKLQTVDYPVLVINSVNDEVQDIAVVPFFRNLPRVKWYQFTNSSHMPFWEERSRYMQVVGDFLRL